MGILRRMRVLRLAAERTLARGAYSVAMLAMSLICGEVVSRRMSCLQSVVVVVNDGMVSRVRSSLNVALSLRT